MIATLIIIAFCAFAFGLLTGVQVHRPRASRFFGGPR